MAREFVGQWSEDRHRATLTGGDARYYVSETEWGEVQAYAILRGISEDSRAIELKRIVVAVPGARTRPPHAQGTDAHRLP